LSWFTLFLLLHIAAAIFAFGPTLVFPINGSLIQKNPSSLHFGMELNHLIESRLVLPLALSMSVTGVAMILNVGINLTKTVYLDVAIILYVIAVGIALFNQIPATKKLIEMSATPPPPGAPPGPPPPAIMEQINRAKYCGMVLTVLLFIIIILMVVKPGGITAGPLFG
jgi:hypothetical protein